MELKEYALVVKKYLLIILAVAVVGGIASLFYSKNITPSYTASLTFYVKRQATEQTGQYYTFDGFYSQQAAEKFTDTLVGFLKSKDILYSAAKIAQFPTDQKSLGQLMGSMKVKGVAPQLVNLSVTRAEADDSKKICVSVAQATTERINLLNQTGDKAISVDLLNTEPLVEKNETPAVLNTLVGVLIGGLLALAVVLFKEYLSES